MKNLKETLKKTHLCGAYFLFAALSTAVFYGCETKADDKAKVKKEVAGKEAFKNGFAEVNGQKMYYEIHGSGRPLLLLHGAYSTINTSFGNIIPNLAKDRQVIAVELQGHGRTSDIDREIKYEFMADDVALLLKQLDIDSADIYGYSMGGGVALQVGIRHPEKVRNLVLVSASYSTKGIYPEVWSSISTITPEIFEGSPFKIEYDSLAPKKEDWPKLVDKLKKLDEEEFDWKPELGKIKSPALLIIADSDIIKPEHAVEMFRTFGGGVIGDFTGLPDSQLAIIPGATHITILEHSSLLYTMISQFLDRENPKNADDHQI